MDQKINILIVEPGKQPYLATVEDTLETFQQIVGGPIEAGCYLPQRVMLVCNSEGKPIPKVARLSQECAGLLTEKQKEYETYWAARQDMIAYQTAKQNIDKILGLASEDQEQNREQKPER